MPPILLLLWSKITVDLVKKLDLVKVLVPPKNFTKSGLYCIYLSICNFPYFLTDKQKTKKVREIQITQTLIVSISYIFCALDSFQNFVKL